MADSCISVDKAEQEANHAGVIYRFLLLEKEKRYTPEWFLLSWGQVQALEI